jgi:cyanate permease
MYIVIINIPQRYQIVNGTSAVRAGILLLPMLVTSPIFSLIPGIVMKKFMNLVGQAMIIGSGLLLAGVAGLGTLGTTTEIHAAEYGFLILIGAGMGLVMPLGVVLIKFICSARDQGRPNRLLYVPIFGGQMLTC